MQTDGQSQEANSRDNETQLPIGGVHNISNLLHFAGVEAKTRNA